MAEIFNSARPHNRSDADISEKNDAVNDTNKSIPPSKILIDMYPVMPSINSMGHAMLLI